MKPQVDPQVSSAMKLGVVAWCLWMALPGPHSSWPSFGQFLVVLIGAFAVLIFALSMSYRYWQPLARKTGLGGALLVLMFAGSGVLLSSFALRLIARRFGLDLDLAAVGNFARTMAFATLIAGWIHAVTTLMGLKRTESPAPRLGFLARRRLKTPSAAGSR